MSTQLVPAPSESPLTHRRPAFDLFEGFALSSVLAGLEIGGLLSVLEDVGLSDEAIAGRNPHATEQLTASLVYLADRGVVHRVGNGYQLTDYGRQICADKGYLVWLVGGYGGPMRQLAAFVTGAAQYGREYTRDGEWVAGGAAMLGRADTVPQALDLLAGIQFRHVLDIGCGNARFLLLTCQRFGASGVGVDLSPEAVELAEQAVEAAGMRDKVQIALGDAADLSKIPRLAETDLVVTFFLLHEILAGGRDALVRYLRELAGHLPAGARLLIAEVEPPERTPTDSSAAASSPAASADGGVHQWFTPEFTYVHAMMSQFLYTAPQWTDALADGGFRVTHVVRSGIPGGLVILCERPAT